MNVLFLFVSLPNLKTETGLFASLIHEFRKQRFGMLVSEKGKGESKTRSTENNSIRVLRIVGLEPTVISNYVMNTLAYQRV